MLLIYLLILVSFLLLFLYFDIDFLFYFFYDISIFYILDYIGYLTQDS